MNHFVETIGFIGTSMKLEGILPSQRTLRPGLQKEAKS
jgi:hypothetical protein